MSNNIEIISGFKFASIADVIFSGVFLKSQIENLNLKENIEDHIGDGEYIFIRKRKFNLKENQIIFCKTEYINELFYILKKQCKFKNIKLITHQSDLKITKKIFSSKPNCISKWYSINVDFKTDNLIPIPIGIANFHSKNLNENEFTKTNEKEKYISSKEGLLYLNFNPNTNFTHRKGLYSYFNKKKWAKVDSASLMHSDYKNRISKHSFVLAPWGNGIDTHRFWETLYSGSIPITKNHMIYNSFNNLPKVVIDKYKDINEEFLNFELLNFKQNIEKFNLRELDFNYWKEIIINENNNVNDTDEQELINHHHKLFRNIADSKHIVKSKFKFLNRFRRIVYKIFKL
jgi:hypothetical protein